MLNNKKIKVIVVDDSFFMRHLLKTLLEADNDIEIIGEANNGEEAFKEVRKLKPDVVIMDYNMPQLNGAEATKKILDRSKKKPAIIMFSAHTKKGTDVTLDCLRAGAVDFILKPSGEFSLSIDKVKDEIIEKIKLAANSKVNRHKKIPQKKESNKKIKGVGAVKLVLVGSSTGGPPVLENIVLALPDKFDFAILIVQHMPKVFTKSFSERLDKITKFVVKEATDSEPVLKNKVYIAPGDYHMELKKSIDNKVNYMIKLTQDPPRHGLRPSIDVLMESAAKYSVSDMVTVILTGMGSDGALGVAAIKERGGYSIVQKPETAVIDSMPNSVIKEGLSDEIVKPEYIVKKIIKLFS